MRIRHVDPASRPRLGDAVVYNMEKYEVVLSGLKYLHIKHHKTGQILSVRLQEVVKWFPAEKQTPLTNMSLDHG